ncbi:MAG: response regulator [Gammaproteobacteria bacterium]|nr:MAG: response regulator [Gammaproteobacteria bacterium]
MNASEEPPRQKVLVIDDSPEIIDLVAGALGGEYQVLATTRGEKGVQLAHDALPALILLDVMMPGMDGYQVCESLKADEATRHIPVIFITGTDAEGAEEKGFALGAVDYVTKPLDPATLVARVRTQVELANTRQALREANRQLEHERTMIAQTIMAMRKSPAFCSSQLVYASKSHDAASGDVVLSARSPNGDHRILLGDFTGHGLPAAIGSPLVAHLFYDAAARGIPFGETLEMINDVLEERLPTNIFMAAVAAYLPKGAADIQVWNFGAPPLLHLAADGSWTEFASRELPMGVAESGEPAQPQTLTLAAGERLYLMSDGPIEAVCRDGQMLGVDGLKAMLEKAPDAVEAVLTEIADRAERPEALDDMTLLRIARDEEENHV